MQFRTLGETDVRLSEVALGTWGLACDAYGPRIKGRLRSVVSQALDSGVTTFDLSPSWGVEGESERAVAALVGGRRDEVVYITRAGVRVEGARVHRELDEESLVASCEASLARLGTDHIDLLLLHDPPEERWRQAEMVAAMQRLVRDGKILCWGASVGAAERARMAVSAGAQALCLVYNILASDGLHDLSADIDAAGCGVLARSPLAYGLLAGRWSERRVFSALDHRRERWTSDGFRARVRQMDNLRFLVHDRNTTLAEAAIRYVLANGLVTTALVGARSAAQIAQAARCCDGPPYLSDEDLIKLSQVLAASGV